MMAQTQAKVQVLEAPVPVQKLSRLSVLLERNSLRLISLIVLLTVWTILGQIVGKLFLPNPWLVLEALYTLVTTGRIIEPAISSITLFCIGFTAALIVGVPLGIILGRSRLAFHFADLYIMVFYATPTIALLPLMVTWFGLTYTTKLIIVFLSAFWPTVINTQVGIQNVDETLVEVGVAFGGRRDEVLRKITLPASVPYVVAGLRIACSRAVIGVIVAELYTSVTGLGAMMSYFSNFFQTANYFASLIILVLFSVTVTEAIRQIEARFTRFRVKRQE